MERVIVVHGRLTGPRQVELDESVTEMEGEVEVVLRPISVRRESKAEDIFDYIARLPGGTRTKEDIDQQIREERDSWGDR